MNLLDARAEQELPRSAASATLRRLEGKSEQHLKPVRALRYPLPNVSLRRKHRALGWRRDHVSFGLLAPAIGPSLTIPLRDGAPFKPSRQAVTGTALTIGLWAGLDTRVAPSSDFGPYIGLQVGVGNMVHPPKPTTR